MNKYEIDINELYRMPFPAICMNIYATIAQDIPNREGYSLEKNNYHLLSPDEVFIQNTYLIISAIFNTHECIERAYTFLKQHHRKNFYETLNMDITEYQLYHYDMVCYKISTLKDLYLKLVNLLYSLRLEGKKCNWKNLEKKKTEINNPALFHFLNKNFNRMATIIGKRNNSAHEGKIKHKDIDEIEIYTTLTKYYEKGLNIEESMTTHNPINKILVQKHLRDFIEEVQINRYNAYIITRCILCSLDNHFAAIVKDKFSNKYSKEIEKSILKFCSPCPLINIESKEYCPNVTK